MLVDLLKNKSIKRQARLERMLDEYQKDLMHMHDADEIEKLELEIGKVRGELRNVQIDLARLADKRTAQIYAKEIKEKLG